MFELMFLSSEDFSRLNVGKSIHIYTSLTHKADTFHLADNIGISSAF